MKTPTRRRPARWEKSRNLGEEILQGIRDVKAGRIGRRFTVNSFAIVRAREKSGLSQAQFAALLGVSVRTLQEWEQGRREPSAAAQILIKVAEKRTKALRGIAPREGREHANRPLGRLRLVPDFLPPPQDLDFRDEDVRDEVGLSVRASPAPRSSRRSPRSPRRGRRKSIGKRRMPRRSA
jgi:putative transcriptional regulator